MAELLALKYADTAKQNFFDFIFTPIDTKGVPLLVHGNYDTLYKKIMNCELICGCLVQVDTTKDGVPIGQQRTDLSSVGIYVNAGGEIPTINNRPLINIVGVVLIDCNNVVYDIDDTDIPFDGKEDDSGLHIRR